MIDFPLHPLPIPPPPSGSFPYPSPSPIPPSRLPLQWTSYSIGDSSTRLWWSLFKGHSRSPTRILGGEIEGGWKDGGRGRGEGSEEGGKEEGGKEDGEGGREGASSQQCNSKGAKLSWISGFLGYSLILAEIAVEPVYSGRPS